MQEGPTTREGTFYPYPFLADVFAFEAVPPGVLVTTMAYLRLAHDHPHLQPHHPP